MCLLLCVCVCVCFVVLPFIMLRCLQLIFCVVVVPTASLPKSGCSTGPNVRLLFQTQELRSGKIPGYRNLAVL